MAKSDGPSRLKLAGKFIALIGCTITVLFWWTNTRNTEWAIAYLPEFVLPPIALGGIVWAVGWILEGFENRGEQRD